MLLEFEHSGRIQTRANGNNWLKLETSDIFLNQCVPFNVNKQSLGKSTIIIERLTGRYTYRGALKRGTL